MSAMRAFVSFLVALLLFAAPAAATWSIVIVNLVTGEVAVGIATCLTGFDLRPSTVVVVPGFGVAAAQSFVGPLSLRELIRTGLLNGSSATSILAQLAAADPSHQTRQYGIVSLVGGRVTFTGTGAGAWAGGLTGQVGDFAYAIQGNVLTGQPVVTAAEQALLTTPGTMGDKLMAAMQAARMMGGDGRCSCATTPTACGSPPPSFTKSAHIGLMILSRPSDVDAPCSGALGCGAGNYWMDLNVANQPAAALDPVLQLQGLYNTWRQNQVGRPDHFQSTVTMSAPVLRADGTSSITGTVWVRDAQGAALGTGLPVTVGLALASTVTGITFSTPQPQANGSYTFTMTGGLDAGTALVDVAINDTFGRVGIWPRPQIQVTDAFGACGAGAVPNGTGGTFDVLRIQGTAGTDRVVRVGIGQPLTLSLSAQPGSPALPAGLFALWAHVGVPLPGQELPLGGSGGSLCFTPAPLAPAPTVLLADSFGLGGVIAAPAAPWSLLVPGVPSLLDVTLQGIMLVAPTLEFAATNAVLLRLEALPTPTITAITPPSPLPGQTVTVQGTNFLVGLQAALAGAPLPINPVSSTSLTFVAPALPCDALLQLANLGSAIVQRLINATPFVNTSSPSGPAAGGITVFFAGLNLLGCTVTIGGAPLNITQQSAGAILGILPPGTPGAVTAVIRNPNGCQTTRTFTYQ